MSRRLRITLLAAAATLATLAAVALLLVYVMLRPERFTRTLQQSARQAGLELTLTAPAHPSLWPRPGVRLQGLQLFVEGQSYPLLVADGGRVVVPWHTIFTGSSDITTLQLDAPRLDLGQLRQALTAWSGRKGSTSQLPKIGTGITLRDGALAMDNRVLLHHIQLHTGPLQPGKLFQLDAQARHRDNPPWRLKLDFTPREPQRGAVELSQIHVDARSGPSRIELAGQAGWSRTAPMQLQLAGEITSGKKTHYQVALSIAPPPAPTGTLHLAVKGPTTQADLLLSPRQLAAWWQRMTGRFIPGPLPQLPLKGSISARSLDLGPVRIEGLQLHSDDTAPAAAGTAPTPDGKSSRH